MTISHAHHFLTFNVWVGQALADMQENLTKLVERCPEPFVALATQETRRFQGDIEGTRRVEGVDPGNPDDGSCLLFVGGKVVKERIVEVGGPGWTGPKHGIAHEPRIFVGATVESRGQRFDVLCIHRSYGGVGSRNEQAWIAEHNAIIEWVEQRLERHPDRPIVILGDWNQSLSEHGPYSVRTLAKRLKAQALIPSGRPAIDGALLINCHGTAKKLAGGFGSDGHHPVLVTVEV